MADIRITQLPIASNLALSTYMVGDNVGNDGTVRFNYALLGQVLAQTLYADTMLTNNELSLLKQKLGI